MRDLGSALELAAHLARAGAAPHRAALAVKKLCSIEARAHKFAEKCCNESVDEAVQERKRKQFLVHAEAIFCEFLPELGIELTAEIQGDPRGGALRLHHPALPSNTWGGKEGGWAV